MRGLAGAIIEEESGLMNVYAETTAVTPHFLENFQLLRDIQRLDERGVDEGHTSSDYPGHRGRPSRQCMLP